MVLPPPKSTPIAPRFPYTTLCRSRNAPFHFGGRLQGAIHEGLAAEAERIDGGLLADRGQHILQRAALGRMLEDVAASNAPHPAIARQGVERAQPREVAGPTPERQRQIGLGAEDPAEFAKIEDRPLVGRPGPKTRTPPSRPR